MRFLVRLSRHRVAGLAVACTVALGGAAGLAVSGAGTADAATCTAGSPCTITGTAGLTGGALGMTTSAGLGWSTTLNSAAQLLVDSTTADQSLTVDDATGSAAGWNVTVDATTFTSGSNTLADSGTFTVNGSTTSQSSATAPNTACTTSGQCTAPTGNTVTYPLAVTTAAVTPTPVTLYSAAAGSGIGSVVVGSTAPIGWWLSLPGNVLAGTYASTIDLNVASGP
jgi:hypothetical protein